VVSSVTSYTTIEHLRTLFATHGLPEVLVFDNGTAFTNEEFAEFTKRNGICHIRVVPYHPSSNSLAERAVKAFKEAMKKASGRSSVEYGVARLLFQYRITPHSTTGVSPAKLLLGRCIRSHLEKLQPNLTDRVNTKQQAHNHDSHAKLRNLEVGDPVFVRNFNNGCLVQYMRYEVQYLLQFP